DPFKDTSGPSMNILIKLMSIVSLVIAPSLAQIYVGDAAHDAMGMAPATQTEMNVTVDADYSAFIAALQADGLYSANTRSISVADGRIVIDGVTLSPEQTAKFTPMLHTATDIELDVMN